MTRIVEVTSLLNGTLDVQDLLSEISFRVPTHHTRDHYLFHIPSHSTSYGNNHSLHRMLCLANSYLFQKYCFCLYFSFFVKYWAGGR